MRCPCVAKTSFNSFQYLRMFFRNCMHKLYQFTRTGARWISERLGLPFVLPFRPKVHDEIETLTCMIWDVSYRNNKLRG